MATGLARTCFGGIDSITIAYRNHDVLTISIRRVGDRAHAFFLLGKHDEPSDVDAVLATHSRRTP